ncbi:MAG: PTS sugar transporter subunit IIA [Nitrospiraceae bacterium]|nr:PTS sugar transporter subunit IIA [Nitrospiraceae bacterium]
MARIQDLLDGDLIIEDLQTTDKAGVIGELAALLQRKGKVGSADDIVRLVMERESQGSTGIGDGIAIPHAKSAALGEMVVAFGRSHRGVDFASLDGKPAFLIFLLVTPEDRPGDHLKTLARISRIMRNPALRNELTHCTRKQEIQRLIVEEDSKYPNSR